MSRPGQPQDDWQRVGQGPSVRTPEFGFKQSLQPASPLAHHSSGVISVCQGLNDAELEVLGEGKRMQARFRRSEPVQANSRSRTGAGA